MISDIRHVHFIGICGTAMGAVAVAMKERGFVVTGSDAGVFPPMSDFLQENGIVIRGGYDAANVPEKVDLVVVGNAISRGNVELEAVLDRRLAYQSLPETLRYFFLRGRRNLVVAGTHGKTTTASLLTHILRVGKIDPAWMIGGIAEDLGKGSSLHESEWVVIEGDEYDTCFFDKGPKFAHYLPELVILNAVELDQMDIYPNLAAVKKAFGLLLRVLPANGVLVYNADCANTRDVVGLSKTKMKVGLHLAMDRQEQIANSKGGAGAPSEEGVVCIEEVTYSPEGSQFTLFGTRFSLPMVGEIYVRNAAMAIAAARHCGVKPAEMQKAVASFQGVLRRQVLRGERDGVKVVEDFGKHPTNIRETLRALAHRFPGARLWAVVDLRANTMCRAETQEPLHEALRFAHGAMLGPVDRPERFAPGEAIEPGRMAKELTAEGHPSFAESGVEPIVARVREVAKRGDVVVVFSSGGFGGIYEKLLG
jgi:UDP-N-acetylmuramate: L-alanyl-gamma-D-glutamyl-meso-diaminopimelate ligase